MASFREAFLGKRFVCCTLTKVYSIYNTEGRSIASIYDLGDIYIGYGPPYRTIYITYGNQQSLDGSMSAWSSCV